MFFNREFKLSKKDIIQIMLMIVFLAVFIIGFVSLRSPELWSGKHNNAVTGYFSMTIAAAILWFYVFTRFFLRHNLGIVVALFVVAMMAYASSYKVQALIKAKHFKKGGEGKAIIIKPQNF